MRALRINNPQNPTYSVSYGKQFYTHHTGNKSSFTSRMQMTQMKTVSTNSRLRERNRSASRTSDPHRCRVSTDLTAPNRGEFGTVGVGTREKGDLKLEEITFDLFGTEDF